MESSASKCPSLTLGLCFVAMFMAALAGTIAENVRLALVFMSVLLVVGAMIVVRSAARRNLGESQTLGVLFFSFAALHAVVGYALAGFSSEAIWIGSRASYYYAQAFVITSLGLFAGATGYSLMLRGRAPNKVLGVLGGVDDGQALSCCGFLVIAGSALMVLMYRRLGLAEYLSDPAKWAVMRYVTSDSFGGSARDEWLINRAMDLITVALPLVLFKAVKRRGLVIILVGMIGSLALMLPLRRANPLSVVMTLFILLGMKKQRVHSLILRVVVVIVIIYAASQGLFMWAASGEGSDPHQLLVTTSSALPEIRDLGWTISLLGNERLNGATFVQAVLPLPSIASGWSHNNSLRAVTTRVIGLDQEMTTGGLRLTITGEGYVNAGYMGVVLAGVLWGIFMGWSEKLLDAARRFEKVHLWHAAALFFVWISFWLYLAGTQAAATIKGGILLLLMIGFLAKRLAPRREIAEGAAYSIATGTF